MNQIQHQALAATAALVDEAAARPARVALVSSGWHRDIVEQAVLALRDVFSASTDPPIGLDAYDVPGAFEIPLHAKLLARSRRYDAIVAVGFVVNGGIYRHDFVAQAVIDGLMRVQIETEVPVFSAVLTPRDFHGHAEHERFFAEHFVVKGREVGAACLRTLASLRALRAQELAA